MLSDAFYTQLRADKLISTHSRSIRVETSDEVGP